MWRLNNVCTNLQLVWLLYEWTQFQLFVLLKVVVVLCMPSFFGYTMTSYSQQKLTWLLDKYLFYVPSMPPSSTSKLAFRPFTCGHAHSNLDSIISKYGLTRWYYLSMINPLSPLISPRVSTHLITCLLWILYRFCWRKLYADVS